MKSLSEISILFFAVLLFFGTEEKTEAVFIHDVTAEYQHTNKTRSSSIVSGNRPDLYGIQPQARSAVSLLRVPPAPQVKDNLQDESDSGFVSATFLLNPVTFYLAIPGRINRSLTIRGLLFPFHSFL